MTLGEQLVWAAEFVRAVAGHSFHDRKRMLCAAASATAVVGVLREARNAHPHAIVDAGLGEISLPEAQAVAKAIEEMVTP